MSDETVIGDELALDVATGRRREGDHRVARSDHRWLLLASGLAVAAQAAPNSDGERQIALGARRVKLGRT